MSRFTHCSAYSLSETINDRQTCTNRIAYSRLFFTIVVLIAALFEKGGLTTCHSLRRAPTNVIARPTA